MTKQNWETPARRKYWDSLKGIKGKNAPNYKEKIGKTAIHHWLRVNYGNPSICEHCGKLGEKVSGKWNIEWANIKQHDYRRIRKDFIGLCKSCHRKYDLTPEKKAKAIKNLHWNTLIIRTKKDGTKFKEQYA